MNEYKQMLEQIRMDALMALSSALKNPAPSYKSGEFEVKHTEYIASLQKTIKWTQEELAKSPSEEITYVEGLQ